MLFVYSTIFVLAERAIAVRLVGSASAGKVEIRYQGQWGTVCGYDSDFWDINRRSRDLSGCLVIHRSFDSAITDILKVEKSTQEAIPYAQCTMQW